MNSRNLLPLALLIIAGCTSPQKQQPQADEPRGSKSTGRDAGPLVQKFGDDIDRMIPAMAAGKIEDRQESQQEFERLCLRAGRPGAQAERVALCTAIAQRLGPSTPKAARVWMLRKLETIANAESVDGLKACLEDQDIEVRDAARRALSANSAPQAATALTGALQAATTDADRVALIQALGWRDTVSFAVIEPYAKSENEQVRMAALDALVHDTSRPPMGPMMAAFGDGNAALRRFAAAVLLRRFDRLLAVGETNEAASNYKFVIRGPTDPLIRLALSRLNILLNGKRGVQNLIRFLNSDNPAEQRLEASGVLDEFTSAEVTSVLCDAFPALKSDAQVLILNVLSRRDDPLSLAPALLGVESNDADVRIAALRLLAVVGGEAQVARLAQRAAGDDQPEAKAAAAALAQLRGKGIDAEIAAELEKATPDVQVELIRALAARGAKDCVQTLLAHTSAKNPSVQVAAFEALGSRGAPADLPALLTALLQARDESVRASAEDAVVAVCQKLDPKTDRAEEVLKRMAAADDADLASFIRVLGRIGGPAALQAIRAAATADPPAKAAARDEAIRALCNWQTPEVLPDLCRIGVETDSEVTRTLAMRGFSKLIHMPTDLSQPKRFRLIQTLLEKAKSTEELRLMLAALGTARVPEALPLADQFVSSDDAANEAALAVISIVKGTPAISATLAQSSVKALLEQKLSDSVKKSATAALKAIEESKGYLRDWEYCGPYFIKGRHGRELADVAFPPEGAPPPAGMNGPKKPEWKPLATFRDDNPWIADLKAIDGSGDRCIYARTTLHSDGEQAARLLVGSDDGIVIWLNGRRIHTAAETRGLTPGQDKIDIQLKPGTNTLMLKVLQDAGEWAFCVGVRTAEGQPLELDRANEQQ